MLCRPAGSKRRTGGRDAADRDRRLVAVSCYAAPSRPARRSAVPSRSRWPRLPERIGLRDVAGFVETVQSLRERERVCRRAM